MVKNVYSNETIDIKCNHQNIIPDTYHYKNNLKFIGLAKIKIGKNTINVTFGSIQNNIEIYRARTQNINYIVPVYVIVDGHNGYFQSDDNQNNKHINACNRIDVCLQLVQSIYANKIKNGKTFSIKSKCKIFRSKLTFENAKSWNSEMIWNYIAREIISESNDFELTKYVAFLSCTNYKGLNGLPYTYENISKNVEANPCISAGGLALLGSGSLYSWAECINEVQSSLRNSKIIDCEKLLDESNYRNTYGGSYSTALGSLCHEIGHLLDLGHTENGIMGNGIDFVHRMFFCKNFTEILPNRILCGQVKKLIISNRITNFKRPGQFMNAYHQQQNNDLTFFDKNCLVILEYHKWINNTISEKELCIHYNSDKNTITSSKYPIQIVEMRDKVTFLVKRYWIMDQHVFHFTLNHKQQNMNNYMIFVMNSNGDILKL